MSASSVCGHWVWAWVVDKFYHDYTEVGGATIKLCCIVLV